MRSDFPEHVATLRRVTLLTLPYMFPLLQALQPVIDPDIWWHLRTGQWIIEHGAVPREDPFSTFGMGKPWVAYSWLFEVTVYGLYQAFGLFGIVLYTVVLSLLIALALHCLVRQFALPFLAEILLTAAGLAAMVPLYSPRPWLLTILLFIVEFHLILRARRSGSHGLLWLLPPLFVFWANVHIQFAYGLFLLVLFTLEPLIDRILPQVGVLNSRKPISVHQSMAVLLACMTATLVTPYHVQLYPTLIGLMGQTGQFRDIVEMQPLPFRDPWSWGVLFLALAAAFSLGRQRDVPPFSLLSFLVGAFVAFRGRRDVWFLVAAAIPIIATARSTEGPARHFSLTRRRLAVVVGVLILIAIVIGWKRNISVEHLHAVVGEHYPVAAAAFVESGGYQGPLYNSYDWGGYLIWRLRSIPVVMDNRGNVHGDARIRRSMETWSGLNDWGLDPELLAARLVIASVKTALASLLRLDSRFELVYEDMTAAVFVARSQETLQQVPTSRGKRIGVSVVRRRSDDRTGA